MAKYGKALKLAEMKVRRLTNLRARTAAAPDPTGQRPHSLRIIDAALNEWTTLRDNLKQKIEA